MTTYSGENIKKLAEKMRGKPRIINKALALALNKSATFSILEAVKEITNEVNLQKNYVKRNIKNAGQASPSKLRAVVQTSTRQTLMYRYPHFKTEDGYKVAINKRGGYQEIRGARKIKLRGSGVSTIAVRNTIAVKALSAGLSKGKGATAGKRHKLSLLTVRAEKKPYGMTPVYSRSITQLFQSAKEDIEPELMDFLKTTFLDDFRRLNK